MLPATNGAGSPLAPLRELHSSSANESRVRQALALACLSSPSSFVPAPLRRYGQNAREGAQRAPPGTAEGHEWKIKNLSLSSGNLSRKIKWSRMERRCEKDRGPQLEVCVWANGRSDRATVAPPVRRSQRRCSRGARMSIPPASPGCLLVKLPRKAARIGGTWAG